MTGRPVAAAAGRSLKRNPLGRTLVIAWLFAFATLVQGDESPGAPPLGSPLKRSPLGVGSSTQPGQLGQRGSAGRTV